MIVRGSLKKQPKHLRATKPYVLRIEMIKVQNKHNLLGKSSVTGKNITQKENATSWILFLLTKAEFKSK